MGRGLKKRGSLARALFPGRRASIEHELYHIIFQLLLVIAVVAVLILYTNRLSSGLAFEKRFSSIDLALVATTVFYAPGTMKLEHQPYPFEVSVEALFGNSQVLILEPGTDLPPVAYWHLSNFNMDMFSESVSLKGHPVENSDKYVSTNITFYKSGRKVTFSESRTHAFHLVCPTVNTSVTDWQSKKLFVPRVFSDSASYADQARSENRIATVLMSQHPSQMISDAGGGGGTKISGIPAEADIVIAIGDSGEQREAGSLVAYIPVDDDLLKSRKLACFLINNLLAPSSVVFYVQIMPVFVENLDPSSGLRVFEEMSNEDQVMVFLDVSGFSSDQMDVNAVSSAFFRAVEQYYGGYDLVSPGDIPFSFTTGPLAQSTVSSTPSGSVEEAIDKVTSDSQSESQSESQSDTQSDAQQGTE